MKVKGRSKGNNNNSNAVTNSYKSSNPTLTKARIREKLYVREVGSTAEYKDEVSSKKKRSREKELKELLKQNPEILMEFLEDWKEAAEMEKEDISKNDSPWRALLRSSAPDYTEEQLDFLETIT